MAAGITDLAGTNFQAGATVTLSKASYPTITALNVVVVSDTQITCTLPITGANIGLWTVTVQNPDTLYGTLPDGFRVNPVSPTPTPTPTPKPTLTWTPTVIPTQNPVPIPKIISINPPSLEQGNGTSLLTIQGINFVSSSRVLWSGVDLKVLSASFSQIIAEVSGSNLTKAGRFVITVLNPGTSCCSFDSVQYNVTANSSSLSLMTSPSAISMKKDTGDSSNA